MTKRRTSLLALLVLAATVVVGTTVLSAPASSHARRPYRHPSQALVRSFHIFRKGAAASAVNGGRELPAAVAEAYAHEGTKASELEPELTKSVYVGGHYPTWIAPQGNQLCIIQSGVVGPGVADSVCGPAQDALGGKLIKVSSTPSGEHVVVGLAPDGNSAVTLTETNGATRSVPVHENTYESIGGHPSSVTLTEAHGNTITEAIPGT